MTSALSRAYTDVFIEEFIDEGVLRGGLRAVKFLRERNIDTYNFVGYLEKTKSTSNAAMTALGYCINHNIGIYVRDATGAKCYQMAANNKYPRALNLLAWEYEFGSRKEESKENKSDLKAKAFKLYSEAAKADYPIAIHNLACCFAEGLGVEKDIKKAIENWKIAAKKGIELSKQKLTIHDPVGKSFFSKETQDTDFNTYLQKRLERDTASDSET